MKKIFYSILLTFAFAGCDLDVNTDPNNPSDVPVSLVLPAAQNTIAACVGDGMYNNAGFFAQYFDQVPDASQYVAISEYTFTQQSDLLNRPYRNLYAGALEDLDIVIKKATSSSDVFAATVLRAYTFQVLVDNMDRVPYSEALQASAIPMPKWDEGQSVYEGVLAEIDAAQAKLDNTPMACSDLMCNKNISQWVGFANALRLRMYLRFIDAGVDASGYTAKVKSLIDANTFFTGSIKFDAYSDESDKRNPWYTTNKISLAVNHCASYPIVSYLLTTNDPRIAFNFDKAVNTGEYTGELPGSGKATDELGIKPTNNDYSPMKYYAIKPMYFFTQSELQSLIAECYIRFYGDNSRAQKAYEASIDADFAERGLSGSAAMYAEGTGTVGWFNATTDTERLELIYMQKWVALCYMDHMEAWSEIRRTDVPKLSSKTGVEIFKDPTVYNPGDLIAPVRNGMGAGKMVKSMFYPVVAKQLNTNTPSKDDASTPVWWDKK